MAAKKIGRPPLFGTPMTAAQHQARHRAKRAEQRRASAPVIPGVMTAAEMMAALGLDPASFPVMSDERIAELRSEPGGADWDDQDQPEIGADGEPVFPEG